MKTKEEASCCLPLSGDARFLALCRTCHWRPVLPAAPGSAAAPRSLPTALGQRPPETGTLPGPVLSDGVLFALKPIRPHWGGLPARPTWPPRAVGGARLQGAAEGPRLCFPICQTGFGPESEAGRTNLKVRLPRLRARSSRSRLCRRRSPRRSARGRRTGTGARRRGGHCRVVTGRAPPRGAHTRSPPPPAEVTEQPAEPGPSRGRGRHREREAPPCPPPCKPVRDGIPVCVRGWDAGESDPGRGR